MRLVPLLAVLISVLASLPGLASAQSEYASLSGFVTDPSGAAIAGVDVQITNVQTNVSESTRTNSSGLYLFPNLHPGEYRLSVTGSGFKQAVQQGLVLHVQDTVSQNFKLEIGSATETVSVVANQLNINTTDGSVSTVVDRQFVENIPLNGRSFQALIELTPGAITTAGVNGTYNGNLSVNGQREDANNFTVDGVSANVGVTSNGGAFTTQGAGASGSLPNLTALSTTQSMVSLDAMQEFRVQTSTYSAEYGRQPGGQISIVTRSGTNSYHGTLFDYLRNTIFDANDWFANASEKPRAPLIQNDFGGVLGGPIRIPHVYNGKDKTFFFFSYEGLRLRLPTTTLTNVPTPAARASAVPSLQPVLNDFPLPDCPSSAPASICSNNLGDGLGDFNASYSNPASINATSLRIDHNFNDKWTAFGRVSYTPSYSILRYPADLAVLNGDYDTATTATFGLTGVLTPLLTNDLRFNYTTAPANYQLAPGGSFGGAVPATAASILPTTYTQKSIDLFVGSSFPGETETTNGVAWADILGGLTLNESLFNVVDTVSYAVGAHQLKFGADWRREAAFAQENQYEIAPGFTNVSQFATGIAPSGSLRAQGNPQPLYYNYSAFAQDHWQVSHRLSLDLGLRWDVNPAPTALNGAIPLAVNQTNNFATMAVVPEGTPDWHTTFSNFGPRLGAAYQISTKRGHELVVRAGFGVFYDTGSDLGSTAYNSYPFNIVEAVPTNIPSISFPLMASQVTPPTIPALNTLTTPPVGGYGTLFLYNPNLKLPYTLQYSVALEQGLGSSQTLTVSYVGASGERLLLNQQYSIHGINPNFTTVDLTTNSATSSYNSLQVQFRRRLSRGLQALASYTWSHAIDTGSTDTASVFPPIRGNSLYDVPMVLAAALTYDVPSPYHEGVGKAILGGWGVDSNIHGQYGLPYNVDVSTTTLNPATGGFEVIYPNVVPGQPLYLYGSACGTPCPGGRRANVNAFTPPLAGQNGDFGRDILRATPDWEVDLAVRREFAITERLRLQFRAEAFNVFNHPNFGIPTAVLTSPSSFGLPTTMLNAALPGINSLYQIGGPRNLQMALKLLF